MTKKDFTATENTDRGKPSEEEPALHQDETTQFTNEANGSGEADVKNAHATGDGSFGRNEGSLPDAEAAPPKNDNIY